MDLVERSGLRGRGGAWFPTAQKWRGALGTQHDEGRVVVANGGEDEPGSVKDRFLLATRAPLVVEGLALSAFAVGATDAFFYVNHHFTDALVALREALGAAEDAGALSDVRVRVVEAPADYVAGEETAAVEVLEGRAAVPRARPPYPTTAGYQGRPTVVSNIETLANVSRIVARGADWFRAVGTREAPGPMLFALEGDVPRPGLYELPLGTAVRTLLVDHGGLDADLSGIGAVRAGGASSAYLTASECAEATLDPDGFAGGTLGAGVFRVLGPHRCMVAEALELATFFENESCGACPPCRMETSSLRGLLSQAAAGKAHPEVFERIGELFDFAGNQGRCSFIRMPNAPFRSAFTHFAADFEAHLAGRPCPVPTPAGATTPA